ncbi:MAG: RNA methyltransferase [Caldilinea sp. CFX5]|nr:RNA methyltransferase [Caldilinea sp. CFX5]
MITSLDNARVKEARKLQRRRQRHKSNALLLEGVRLVRDAFQSGAPVRELYFAPELVAEHGEAQQLLATLTAAKVDLLACNVAVLASLTETVTPQGVVAVVTLPVLPLPARVDFVLILDQVRDPGNAGTLLRAAEAAGVTLAIFGPETVDPYNDKVLRAGMGAHFRLPLRLCPNWPAIQALLPTDMTVYLAQAGASLAYDAVDWRAPAALVVGGEAAGASPTAYQVAQSIAIPMHGQVESLNAAMAGTVILFEAARQRRQVNW